MNAPTDLALADAPTSTRPPRSLARFAAPAARILLGLVFFVFGLDYFVGLFPKPTDPLPADLTALMNGFIQSHYLFPLIKGTEVVVGALLLSNRFVPLALTLIAPVIVNIVAVHAFLAPSGLPVALFVLVLELYLAWSHRAAFRPMLASR
jgi:hypothetical protein